MIYANEENGYTVLKLERDDGETHTVTGTPEDCARCLESATGAFLKKVLAGNGLRNPAAP